MLARCQHDAGKDASAVPREVPSLVSRGALQWAEASATGVMTPAREETLVWIELTLIASIYT